MLSLLSQLGSPATASINKDPLSSPINVNALVPPLFLKRSSKFLTQECHSRNSQFINRKFNTVLFADAGGGRGATSAPPNSNPTSTATASAPDADESISLVGEESVPLEGVIQLEKPNSSSPLSKWGWVALLAGVDVLALLMFSAIGRFSHGFSVFDTETLRTADPFIAGWFLSAYFLGGFGEDGRGSNGVPNAVMAAAKSWALGIPLGLIIRAASVGHTPPTNIILVTMGSTAILLIGWRALLFSIFGSNKSENNDLYKRGNPFELFELLTSLVRRW